MHSVCMVLFIAAVSMTSKTCKFLSKRNKWTKMAKCWLNTTTQLKPDVIEHHPLHTVCIPSIRLCKLPKKSHDSQLKHNMRAKCYNPHHIKFLEHRQYLSTAA